MCLISLLMSAKFKGNLIICTLWQFLQVRKKKKNEENE